MSTRIESGPLLEEPREEKIKRALARAAGRIFSLGLPAGAVALGIEETITGWTTNDPERTTRGVIYSGVGAKMALDGLVFRQLYRAVDRAFRDLRGEVEEFNMERLEVTEGLHEEVRLLGSPQERIVEG